MPQKPLFSRNPLLSLAWCTPGNGLVRTQDERITRLYQMASEYQDLPALWEGQFRLACLLKNAPEKEPVTNCIRTALADTETGALEGSLILQTAIARAALSLFEYHPDRTILKRLAAWCRYLEIEWEALFSGGETVYRPGDLMDFFVRFYRISGIRSILRLCARLRSASFDWTTSLHTFQQSIPLGSGSEQTLSSVFSMKTDEMDYDLKQFLVNHAEMLADGFRYTLYSGMFSGNGQDLSAGKTAWTYIGRHHRAVCGGTTADPLLAGSSSAKPVSNLAMAAWTEGFAAQLLLPGGEWALDELARLVFNGLTESLSHDPIRDVQFVNTSANDDSAAQDIPGLLSRLTRAAATAWQNAVMLSENGIRINYCIPCRVALRIQGKTVMLEMDEDRISLHTDTQLRFPVEIGYPITETADILILHGKEERCVLSSSGSVPPDRYIHLEETWSDLDEIRYSPNSTVRTEQTHHQGHCFFVRNRLLSADITGGFRGYAVCDNPKVEENRIVVPCACASGWHAPKGIPADIPVLPRTEGETVTLVLTTYERTEHRISMFPRASEACLK